MTLIALVGPPNAGKSSLLHALSDVQIKKGNYAFTTLRPVPALVRIDGVLVQFVEIPGLLEGANDDHGGRRAYLGVLREEALESGAHRRVSRGSASDATTSVELRHPLCAPGDLQRGVRPGEGVKPI